MALVPTLMAAKTALDMVSNFQGRRAAKKAAELNRQQEALGGLSGALGAAGSGLGSGLGATASRPATQAPSALQTINKSVDPLMRDLLPILMNKKGDEGGGDELTNALKSLMGLLSSSNPTMRTY